MLLPLALLLCAASFSPASSAQDTVIAIDLNSDGRYVTGDRARVKVRASDGYLVVLRTDVNGWVRVMYPVDPSDDNFVHGGRDVEIRGRAGRESFQTGLTEGAGTILAARSAESFHFNRYVRDGHWNYRALDSLRAGPDSDAETTLLGVVQQMAGDSHFDYDVAAYSVTDRDMADGGYAGAYPPPAYRYGPYPYGYDPYFYDPFYYSAYWYAPLYFNAYCFGCFPRFYFSAGFVRPFRPYRPFGPVYRPRGAAGFGTGMRGRSVPMRAPTRGASPSRGASSYGARSYGGGGRGNGGGGARAGGGGGAARGGGGGVRGGGGGGRRR